MNRPRDIDDYSQCVRVERINDSVSTVYIFCVECDDWYKAAVLSRSEIILRQMHGMKIIDHDLLTCVCGNEDCLADIDYLLTPQQRELIIRNAFRMGRR